MAKTKPRKKNKCKCMYCGTKFKLDHRNRRACCIKCEMLNDKLLKEELLKE